LKKQIKNRKKTEKREKGGDYLGRGPLAARGAHDSCTGRPKSEMGPAQ
jgi:hypothetical protein